MSQAAPPAPDSVRRPISIARLHGEACIGCGAVHRKLYAAGAVRVEGKSGTRTWPVVACNLHRVRGDAR